MDSDTPATVLLVEDDPNTNDLYRVVLERAGYAVLSAFDGEDAIRLATTEAPDLIILDVVIPRIPGWGVARILRSDPRTEKIPIVAVTGHEMLTEHSVADELGIEGYLRKPVELRDLIAEIARVLDRGARSSPR